MAKPAASPADETAAEAGDGEKNEDGATIIGTMNYRRVGNLDGAEVKKPGAQEPYPLCRIFGRATNVIVIEDPRKTGNTFYALGGSFQAINLHTGEVYASGKCFLPSGIHELVLEPLQGDSPASSVEFAFDLFSVRSGNLSGYSVIGKSLREVKMSDSMLAMKKNLPPVKLVTPPKQLTDK
jgi:hypothetical protein